MGKTLVPKDLLIRVEIGLTMLSFKNLRILTGMLWGLIDFDSEKEPITFSGLVGERKIEF